MHVEIWSDVVCPWCYIGKRRFENALAQFSHRDAVSVTWRSFELDPHAPRHSDGTMTDLIARKLGGNVAQAAALNAQISGVAAGEGLDYHLDQAQHGNTFDAHRLLHLATAHGLQDAAEERLMHAYFTDGMPIGDADTLIQLAAEIGMDANEARAILMSDTYAAAVRADEQRASALGIRGVPFVVIDERYGISGAQQSAVFLEALEAAWTESHPLTAVGAVDAANACEDDRCDLSPERTTVSGSTPAVEKQ